MSDCLPNIHSTTLLVVSCPSAKFLANILQPNTIPSPSNFPFRSLFEQPRSLQIQVSIKCSYEVRSEFHQSSTTRHPFPIFLLRQSHTISYAFSKRFSPILGVIHVFIESCILINIHYRTRIEPYMYCGCSIPHKLFSVH
jgi:hypothetical protein